MKGILKGLFSLCISIVGIVSFCNADTISDYIKNDISYGFNYDVSNGTTWTNVFQVNGSDGGYICFFTDANYVSNITPSTPNTRPYITFRQSNYSNYNGMLYLDQVFPTRFLCFELHSTGNRFNIQAQFQYAGYNGVIPIHYFFMKDLLNSSYVSSCPSQFTSEECQQEYNLMPIENVDSNYCEINNLCPIYTGDSGDCNTGDINWSSLYINDIQHLGGSSIYLDIPEEINWDYQYSSNDDMFIDIVGYNVDYDSISGAIAIQNYKADSSDLNKIITELIPLFIPGLVIILFLYFVFRFIKKIF